MREGPAKSAAFRALRLSGLLALAEARAGGLPILAYHGVTADQADAERASRGALRNRRRLHVPRSLFAAHLRLLASRWCPITLAELCACLAEGRPLPRRGVVLTFDDGYRNLLTQALPLLREHGLPATVFVVTGGDRRPFWQDRLEAAVEATRQSAVEWRGRRHALDPPAARARTAAALEAALDALGADAREAALERLTAELGGPGRTDDEDRRRLSWDELRALAAAGLEIGSHADRHEPLTARGAGEAAAALVESRRTLERELCPMSGREGAGPRAAARPPALSYPYGARNASLAAAARSAGFACGLTGAPRLVRPGADLFDLGRFLVGADDDVLRLRASLSGLRSRWQADPFPPRP